MERSDNRRFNIYAQVMELALTVCKPINCESRVAKGLD